MKKELLVEIKTLDLENNRWFYADIYLPAESYEIEDALQRARITGDDTYREYSIYECRVLPLIEAQRLDSPTIEELNFFAQRLAALSDEEKLVFNAVAPKYLPDEGEELISGKDLINLTFGLDKVMVASGVEDLYDLGQFVIDNELNEAITNTPEEARPYLDRRKIGEMQQETDGGVFIGGRYVVTGDYRLQEVYNGRQPLPTEDMQTHYAFRLLVMAAPDENVTDGVEMDTQWISLPIDKGKADQIAAQLGAERIEDCVYLDFESTIPQVDSDHFGDMHDFVKLNCLAQMLLEMTPSDQVKFKAVLSSEQPSEIEDILDIARNLHQYEFANQVEDANQFFKDYMIRHMDTRADPKWINSLLVRSEGNELLKRVGGTITEYGIVSKRGKGLYNLVSRDEMQSNPLLSEKLALIKINGQTALFSNSRILELYIPNDLYKYELRGGENINFASIEKSVMVNHSGTILVKKPFDFNGASCIILDDESSPNFWGEDVSVKEFMETDYDQEEPEKNEEPTMKMGGM